MNREEAIADLITLKEFFEERSNATPVCLEYAISILECLPELEKGNWIGIDDEPHDEWECDRCGFIYDGSPPPNFCENCGADMRGE